MRPETVFMLIITIVLTSLAFKLVNAWRDYRLERLRVLEKTLTDPSLDADTRRMAIQQLEGASSRRMQTWMVGAGWIGLFLGIPMLASGNSDGEIFGGIVMGLGFAFVSLPLVLREIDVRQQA